MSDPETTTTASWDHRVGQPVVTFTPPFIDTLILITVEDPRHPKVIHLSGETAPLLDSDRDRALLRAFCTLALQRLDTLENTTDADQRPR